MPFLNFDNAQIYYEVVGQGQAFVMLHAGIAHSAMWGPQFEYFQKNYRAVRYDQRGFGKTVATTKEFNYRADLRALLDHLDIARAILMGCSMGGSLALDFTLEHPARVSALILIAAGYSGFEAPPEMKAQWDEQTAAFAAGDIERVIDLELKMWVDGPHRTPDQAPSHVREQVRAMELDNLKIDTDGYNPVELDPPARGRLNEVNVPTLVIYGAGDQPTVVENGETLAREIPNAQVLILENVGHVPSMEKPEEVNWAVEKFLRAL